MKIDITMFVWFLMEMFAINTAPTQIGAFMVLRLEITSFGKRRNKDRDLKFKFLVLVATMAHERQLA